MANEKKNGTLEEIIVEMLKEGKAVRIPLKEVVDKMQENVKAAEDAQEAVQRKLRSRKRCRRADRSRPCRLTSTSTTCISTWMNA